MLKKVIYGKFVDMDLIINSLKYTKNVNTTPNYNMVTGELRLLHIYNAGKK